MTQVFRVTLPVNDLNLAVRFYTGVLGLDGERVSAGWHYFKCGSVMLACHNAAAEREPVAVAHQSPLFIALDDRLDHIIIRARNHGATLLDAEVTRLPTGESGFRMRDPFGNALWIVEARSMQWGRGNGRGPTDVWRPQTAETPVMLFQRDFLNAVKGGELARMKELLALDPQLASCTDASGVSALMLAAYKRHQEVAAHLLTHIHDLSVWEAAAMGEVHVLKVMLQQDPALARTHAVDGYLPLGLAAFFGHADCVRLLIEQGADVNAVSRNAMHVRPLHSAVTQAPSERALPVVQLLVDAGAEINVGKSGGYTPLHLAVNRDEYELAELLLCYGADMNHRAGDGRSALDVVRVRKNQSLMALFEAHQAKQSSAARA